MRTLAAWSLATLLLIGLPGFAIWSRLEAVQSELRWAAYRAAAQQRGVKLTPAELFNDPPIPDDQNFAATPLWHRKDSHVSFPVPILRSLSDRKGEPKLTDFQRWRTDLEKANWLPKEFPGDDVEAVLASTDRFTAELSEMRAARHRPHAVFPVRRSDNWLATPPHVTLGLTLGNVLNAKIAALLQLGRAEEAFETWKDLSTLSRAMGTTRSQLATMVSHSQAAFLLQRLGQALDASAWNEATLREVERELATWNPLASFLRGLEGERARANAMIEICREKGDLASLVPGVSDPSSVNTWIRLAAPGFWRGNQLWLNQSVDEELAAFHEPGERWNPITPRSFDPETVESEPDHQRHTFTLLLLGSSSTSLRERALFHHAMVRMAGLACALELHRLRHGTYPETLEALVPAIVARLPHDPCTGAPFHYRRSATEGYLLYAEGMNRQDDLGRSSWMDRAARDWRWWAPRPKVSK